MIGEKIGDYEIVQSLGKGGFGSVWKATSGDGVEVALKILNPQVLENQKVVTKFFHEAMILAKLDHPNICKLMEFFPSEDNYAIAMEFVEGSELKKILQQNNGPLPFDAAYQIAKQTLDAFHYADQNGILHRDIKPANIMISKDGNSKIMDFGIAKMGTTASHDTAASMLSIHYTPPERFDKTKETDARSDIYALGLVFYEMFAGRRPFTATETTQIMFFHLNEIPDPPSKYDESLPPNVSEAISKALEKEPSDRFQTFKEFSNAMDTGEQIDDDATAIIDLEATVMAEDLDISAARPAPAAAEAEAPKKKSKTLFISIAAAVLVALIGGFFFWITRPLPIPGVTSLNVSVVSPGEGYAGDSFEIKLITSEIAAATFVVIDGKEYTMKGEGTQWGYVAKVDKPGATTFSVFAKNKDDVQGQPKEGTITALAIPIPDVTSIDVSVVSPGEGYAGDSFEIKLITNEIAEATFVVIDGNEYTMEGEGTQWRYVAKIDKPGDTPFSVFAKNRKGVQGQPKEGTITALMPKPLPTAEKNAKGFWVAPHPFDGSIMVIIPSGEFTMGSEEYSAEEPIQKIYLDTYFIDKYLVTNEKFQKFVDETGYETDAEKEGAGLVRIGRRLKKLEGANWNMPDGLTSIDGKETHPVSQVSYNDALSYCQWAKKDLPTEAQWEKAARGPDGNQFPWGDKEPDDTMANFDNMIGHPAPVDEYKKGQSHYGVFDMAGNVYQWCKDWFATGERNPKNPAGPETGEERIIKGGSFSEGIDSLRSANRDRYEPTYSSFLYGFRCACEKIEVEENK